MDSIGLWLVKTQTIGTAVPSVTVTGAFSATYDNYLVTMTTTPTANASYQIVLGASNTAYFGFLVYGDAATNTVVGVGRNNQPVMNYLGGGTANQVGHLKVDIFSPFKATYTRFMNGVYQDNVNFGTMQGEHRVASSYADFTISTGTGTFTGGTVCVYGYRN
jgi:pyruvate/2-oxoacid:ferredoxin oxidoreductase alpha subunit